MIDDATDLELLGLSLAAGTIRCEELGIELRVVMLDGVELFVTSDCRTDRVNVSLEADVITCVYGRG